MTAPAVAAHRLVLDSTEWAVLAVTAGVALPPEFMADSIVDGPVRRAAAQRLIDRGVAEVEPDRADGGVRPVAAVAANLGVLAAPVVSLRVDVAVRGRTLRAVFTVRGALGASVVALADSAVELSMFPAVTLGRELLRAVADPADLLPDEARIRAALAVMEPGGSLTGRLPLAALRDVGEAAPFDGARSTVPAGAAGLTGAQADLAARVARQTSGTLRCLVTGRGQDGAVAAGQVVWLCTDDGWLGLRPDPDDTGRRMVTLEPVDRADLGVWVTPYVAAILDGAAR